MTMNLRALLDAPMVPDIVVGDLVLDSREVKPGDAFVAMPGSDKDGRQYISAALERGASAVLCEAEGAAEQGDSRVVPLPALRSRLGALANRFYGSPSEALTLIAVTGTNGKTSVVDLTAQMLRQVGHKVGSIGTLGARLTQAPVETGNTTPDCLALHRQLRDWRDKGVGVVTLEASSHALDQGRLDGLSVDTGLFTNLSRDHLDYHPSMQAYCDAKLKLFRDFNPARRIYNADDDMISQHADVWSEGGIGISVGSRTGEVSFEVRQTAPLLVAVSTPWGDGELKSTLSGRFNAFNLVAALTVTLASGVPFSDALSAAEAALPVAGRLQTVDDASDITVIIDYAHTPDALARALSALAESDRCGQLWVLFGCGGDRDRGKRAEMGEVACRFADRVVITSDNPRSEAPASIIEDILEGCGDCAPLVEVDRAAAIAFAVSQAHAGDTVLIAGKGHETYQEVAGVRSPFSDADCAAAQLLQRRAA